MREIRNKGMGKVLLLLLGSDAHVRVFFCFEEEPPPNGDSGVGRGAEFRV